MTGSIFSKLFPPKYFVTLFCAKRSHQTTFRQKHNSTSYTYITYPVTVKFLCFYSTSHLPTTPTLNPTEFLQYIYTIFSPTDTCCQLYCLGWFDSSNILSSVWCLTKIPVTLMKVKTCILHKFLYTYVYTHSLFGALCKSMKCITINKHSRYQATYILRKKYDSWTQTNPSTS